MSKEAMKLALEALEPRPGMPNPEYESLTQCAITALQEALAEQPAQQALDKMAENARELGIQMQPEEPRAWFTVDELNAWADKKLKENPQWAEQPAQQEPVARYKEKCADGSRCLHGCLSGEACHTSPPAQRKPLTPEWIWTWLMDWCKRNGSSPANYNSLFKMVADARAIEAAHGIKE